MVLKRASIRTALFLIVLITMVSLTGCWEKQDHDLLLPETPHYRLTGTVVNEVSQLPLPNIQVSMSMAYSIYNVDWASRTITTDSAGFFQIDTIYPGTYTAKLYRNGYQVLDQPIFQSHEDKDLFYSIPEPLVSAGSINLGDKNPGGSNPKFTWQGSILWIMGVHEGTINNQNYPVGVPALIPARISGNMILYDRAFHNPSPDALGIVSAFNKLYAYYRDHAELISQSTGLISSEVSWEGLISGMTVRDGQFYTTWSNDIQSRGTDLTSVNAVLETNAENLKLLTHDDQRFWAFDQNRDLVVNFDTLGTVSGAYKLFRSGTPYPLSIKSMGFDSLHHLWISDASGISRYLYWFE